MNVHDSVPVQDLSSLTLDQLKATYEAPGVLEQLGKECRDECSAIYAANPCSEQERQSMIDASEPKTIALQMISYGMVLAKNPNLKACQELVNRYRDIGYTAVAQELEQRGLDDYTMADINEAYDPNCRYSPLEYVMDHVDYQFKDNATVRIKGYLFAHELKNDGWDSFRDAVYPYTKDPWTEDEVWLKDVLEKVHVQEIRLPELDDIEKAEKMGFIKIAQQMRAMLTHQGSTVCVVEKR